MILHFLSALRAQPVCNALVEQLCDDRYGWCRERVLGGERQWHVSYLAEKVRHVASCKGGAPQRALENQRAQRPPVHLKPVPIAFLHHGFDPCARAS